MHHTTYFLYLVWYKWAPINRRNKEQNLCEKLFVPLLFIPVLLL